MDKRELIKEIKTSIKNQGIPVKGISVKIRDTGYSESIYVTVKNPLIRKSEVEDIVKKFQEVKYDKRTGEILQGANRFVEVSYADNTFDEVIEPYMSKAESVFSSDEYNGKIILENNAKKVWYYKEGSYECRLLEENKGATSSKRTSKYSSPLWVMSTKDLAIIFWRFDNLGTIYD